MAFQGMLFHWSSICLEFKVAHFSLREVIWLALIVKVLSFITMNHHHRKSASFQSRAKFELLSHPLQASFRFFQVPIPSKPLSTLRLSTPSCCGELIGLTMFPNPASSRYLRANLYPGVHLSVCWRTTLILQPELVPFGPSVIPVFVGK